ncbi:MAG: STAS domain-containing protein [Acidimicrobiales bacterium]|jgi:anti-anti-sigma factor
MTELDDSVTASVKGTLDPSGGLRLFLTGELDIVSVDGVKEVISELFASNPRRVVFDLERLTFMDSSGIALMLQLSRRVDSVEVVNATPIVRRVIEATGLDQILGLQS